MKPADREMVRRVAALKQEVRRLETRLAAGVEMLRRFADREKSLMTESEGLPCHTEEQRLEDWKKADPHGFREWRRAMKWLEESAK